MRHNRHIAAMADADQRFAAIAEPAPARPAARAGSDPGLGAAALVAFLASIMALTALGIDSMLPALPAIGRSLDIASENQRQWIVVVFMLGFGAAQIVWGPLADRYGRKPILFVSLILYTLLSIAAGLATSFPMLLCARLLQGIAASTSRVLVVAIIRDCYEGRRMARVMSLTFTIFLVVPILAPSVGQLLTAAFGSWRSIFFCLAGYGAMMAVVAGFRLRETLHPEHRQALSFATAGTAMRRVITDRVAIGYTLASAFAFGAMSGFITSVQQIVADIFQAPRLFPLLFAGMAGAMGIASFLNSRFVERLGTRRISHAALLGFILASAAHLAIALLGSETLVGFAIVQAAQMFFFGLMGANFGAMAMEPVGDIAGAASSVQGFLSTCLGALLGSLVGQAFNGTTVPLATGFLLLGAAALAMVLWTERGRLFRPQHAGS